MSSISAKIKNKFLGSEKSVAHSYANAVYVDYNPIEFFLKFGLSEPRSEKIIDFAKIHLSPQYALLLNKILTRNIEEYEKRVGRINLPKSLLEEIGETKEKKQ